MNNDKTTTCTGEGDALDLLFKGKKTLQLLLHDHSTSAKNIVCSWLALLNP